MVSCAKGLHHNLDQLQLDASSSEDLAKQQYKVCHVALPLHAILFLHQGTLPRCTAWGGFTRTTRVLQQPLFWPLFWASEDIPPRPLGLRVVSLSALAVHRSSHST